MNSACFELQISVTQGALVLTVFHQGFGCAVRPHPYTVTVKSLPSFCRLHCVNTAFIRLFYHWWTWAVSRRGCQADASNLLCLLGDTSTSSWLTGLAPLPPAAKAAEDARRSHFHFFSGEVGSASHQDSFSGQPKGEANVPCLFLGGLLQRGL